jgi:hypothetical protein
VFNSSRSLLEVVDCHLLTRAVKSIVKKLYGYGKEHKLFASSRDYFFD